MSFELSKIINGIFSLVYTYSSNFVLAHNCISITSYPFLGFWFFSNKLKRFSKDGKKDYNCKLLFSSIFYNDFFSSV